MLGADVALVGGFWGNDFQFLQFGITVWAPLATYCQWVGGWRLGAGRSAPA